MDGESDSNGLYFLLMIYRGCCLSHGKHRNYLFEHGSHRSHRFLYLAEFLIICPAEPKVGALGEAKGQKGRKFLFSRRDAEGAEFYNAHRSHRIIILCLVGTGYICRKHCPSRFYRICRVTLSHIYPRLPYSR